MARALREAGIVETISPQSVQRILESQKLKPWRVHHWLSSKVPRDEAFYAQVMVVRDLYTRVLEPHECVSDWSRRTSETSLTSKQSSPTSSRPGTARPTPSNGRRPRRCTKQSFDAGLRLVMHGFNFATKSDYRDLGQSLGSLRLRVASLNEKLSGL